MSSSQQVNTRPEFIFVTCQKNAQAACKQEVLEYDPSLRFAFSRPGLMTFKTDVKSSLEFGKPFFLPSIFARAFGFSISNLTGNLSDHVETIRDNLNARQIKHLHVWRRRDQDLDPAADPPKMEEQFPALSKLKASTKVNEVAAPDEWVLDLIEVDDDRWLMGQHLASATFQRWPGGKPPLAFRADAISRAYYKTQEGILWSQIPMRAGDTCAEIGAAPGGSIQALLGLDCKVLAVDPAELDGKIAAHPNLKHFRRRGREVRKSEFANVRWLLADLNVAPQYTLDTIEDIVANQNVHIRGMLLTLKLMDGITSRELLVHVERIKKLGFRYVKIRQLAFNRNEVCLFALKQKAERRPLVKSRQPKEESDQGEKTVENAGQRSPEKSE